MIRGALSCIGRRHKATSCNAYAKGGGEGQGEKGRLLHHRDFTRLSFLVWALCVDGIIALTASALKLELAQLEQMLREDARDANGHLPR